MAWAMILMGVASVASGDFSLLWLGPDDLVGAKGVEVRAQAPEESLVLVPADAQRSALWYMPVAAHRRNGEILVWYQRVDRHEVVYSDQRVLCLAVLRDGEWSLPSLRDEAVSWGGPNNVVLRRSPYPPTWGGFNVHQIVFTRGQFRMLYWDQPEQGDAGAMTATSPDGLNWSKDSLDTVFTEHNDAFTLLQKDGQFLLYQTKLEDWPDKPVQDNLPGKRRVQSVRTSTDLVDWTPQEVFLRPDDQDDPRTEFYLMKAFPYGNGYAGLVMKYYGDPAMPGKHSAILKTELVVSRDARTWSRPFRETDLGFWSYADPFVERDRLCFVTAKERGISLVKYASPRRLTGVVCEQDGELMTRPFVIPEGVLALDADAREGWIDVELLDKAGNPLGGLGPCRTEGIEGARIPLDWGGFSSGELPLLECRLRVRMHRAKLFAITTLANDQAGD